MMFAFTTKLRHVEDRPITKLPSFITNEILIRVEIWHLLSLDMLNLPLGLLIQDLKQQSMGPKMPRIQPYNILPAILFSYWQ